MQRNFGLDLLRCFAIIGVLVEHITYSPPLYVFGAIVPVDLFFSLSGFLIAQMIAERFGGIRSLAALWAFLANRWLRTIPLYLLALCCYLVVLGMIAPVSLPSVFLRYATFTQYIPGFRPVVTGQTFFTISWSLCIEEWFYILCPMALLLIGSRSPRFMIGAAAVLVGLSITWRLTCNAIWPDLGIVDFYRISTLTRADAFVWGMGAYWLVRHGVSRHIATVLMLAGLALAAINYGVLYMAPEGLYSRILLPAAAPLSMALLIPATLAWQAAAVLQVAAAWLSTRTYAIYLFHVFAVTAVFSPNHHTVTGFVLFLLMTGLGADFLYRYVERPFMRMRPMRAPIAAAVSGAP
jgi:peptidoglycan/LPS O-acetylase OafA/YrhL